MNRPEIFRGDSARRYFAMQTCERVGSALQEFPRPRRSFGRLALEAAVLIAAGLVILSFVGRVS